MTDLVCVHAEHPPISGAYDDHINVTEMWPVVVAMHRWCHLWKNKLVWLVTDNTQVEGGVNSGRSANPYSLFWLREIFWVAAFYNIHLRAIHIPSGDNRIADSLSRLKNPDCVDVCCDLIPGFIDCCYRVGHFETRVGSCKDAVLVRRDDKG